MGFIDEQRCRVLEWLDAIKGDVQVLVIHNHIFWEIQKIIRENHQLVETPSVFYEWLAQVFANSTVLGVRRQADRGSDTISMLRLLGLLKSHPKILSRSYYLSLYDSDSFEQVRAARAFAKYAGKGAERFDSEYFDRDIKELRAKTERLHHFADRRIAHRDARGLEYEQPRFNELTTAIGLLERLTIKYLALLKAESWGTLLPTFQYDWKEVFTFPWIGAASTSD